jgi:hypothetical protein
MIRATQYGVPEGASLSIGNPSLKESAHHRGRTRAARRKRGLEVISHTTIERKTPNQPLVNTSSPLASLQDLTL